MTSDDTDDTTHSDRWTRIRDRIERRFEAMLREWLDQTYTLYMSLAALLTKQIFRLCTYSALFVLLKDVLRLLWSGDGHLLRAVLLRLLSLLFLSYAQAVLTSWGAAFRPRLPVLTLKRMPPS